jgi:transposase
MWVPPEDTDPVVFHAPTRKSVGVFGAVRAEDGRLVTRKEERFCAMSFLDFLKQLVRHRRRDRTMLVVVDNARWHHARLVRPWLDERRDVIRLDFLPPYSPDLNNIERVWKLVRRLCTHNRYFPKLDRLIHAVFEQFAIWSRPNQDLRRLCAII